MGGEGFTAQMQVGSLMRGLVAWVPFAWDGSCEPRD